MWLISPLGKKRESAGNWRYILISLAEARLLEVQSIGRPGRVNSGYRSWARRSHGQRLLGHFLSERFKSGGTC